MSGVRLEAGADGLAGITLAGPRANALEPSILDDLRRALDAAEASAPEALLLTGGRNFCSGGDVAGFAAAAREGGAAAYARRVVPVLQEIVLRLLVFPAPVCVAARGAVTGGGAGLLFAADRAIIAPDCFVQPYYGPMGFAPDGGWTALLPERIGAGRALGWLAANRRAGAEELVALGLAEAVAAEPEAAMRAAFKATGADPAALIAARRLVWDEARLATIAARLEAETAAFMEMIGRGGTLARMESFLA